jgi:RNA polymerase sigma-70 factor (ECF subfamily)
MNLKDQYLLGRIKRGDIGAFEKMFHQFYPGMCSYAEKLVSQAPVAEEVVQDVFYNIWKNRDVFRVSTSLKSYLYRSVFNNSMMYLRKSKREVRMDKNTYELSDFAPGPVEEFEGNEVSDLINNTLENLPERTREIFQLSRFDGLKYKEIANRLSISVKTVEANMGKALRALKTSLDEYGQKV